MLSGVQRIWIPGREQVEPRRDLTLIAKERAKEPKEKGGQPTVDQKREPGDRDGRQDEQAPDRENDVMRNDKGGAEKDGESPPAQRLAAFHPDATVSHARYRSGYEAGTSGRACARLSASRLRRQREWQAAHQGGVRVEGRRHLRQVQPADQFVRESEEPVRPGQERRQDAAGPRSRDH